LVRVLVKYFQGPTQPPIGSQTSFVVFVTGQILYRRNDDILPDDYLYLFCVISYFPRPPPPPHRVPDQLRRLRYWSNGCTGENSKYFSKFEIYIVNFKIIYQISIFSKFKFIGTYLSSQDPRFPIGLSPASSSSS